MINNILKKHEIKEKHQIYVETFAGKTTGKGENFSMNMIKNIEYNAKWIRNHNMLI